MKTLHCGTVAHLRDNPFSHSDALEIIETGALLVDCQGYIEAVGDEQTLRRQLKETPCHHQAHGSDWLLPGLVDGHSHFPQYYATACSSEALLQWVTESIFPAECELDNEVVASEIAERYIAHLLSCGTTTAMLFGSQFFDANQALIRAARGGRIRLILGMTMMDRFGPEQLMTSPEHCFRDSEKLIRLCKDDPLLHYAVTPRFALSFSPALAEVCRALIAAHPDCYLQTHINENKAEIKVVRDHFPAHSSYLDVYDQAGFLSSRTVLTHSIHSTDDELKRIQESDCVVCSAPSSNLFLGSGLFPLKRHLAHRIPLLIGTDIGAGTHFSIWQELADFYKIQMLLGTHLTAAELLYLGTLSAAQALKLDHQTGNFMAGKSADFFILSTTRESYLTDRLKRCQSSEEQLFVLLMMAGPQQIKASYLQGKAVFQRGADGSA